MRPNAVVLVPFLLLALSGLTGWQTPVRAQQLPDAGKGIDEMPVLTGDVWRTMSHDAKIAFIWGIGHVVTVEENVMQRHPELRKVGFVAKLSEGLRGVPMDAIARRIDDYYQRDLSRLDQPVMRVIWGQIVRPKLKTGVVDQPLDQQEER